MKIIRVFIIAFAFSVVSSCTDDPETIMAEGVLRWEGDPTLDGCGYFITIHDHEYKPEYEYNIDSSFETDSTNVIVEYQLLNRIIKGPCNLVHPIMTDGIKLISITRK